MGDNPFESKEDKVEKDLKLHKHLGRQQNSGLRAGGVPTLTKND